MNKELEKFDIERDLYLKSFYDNERLGPLTGKASIDRPWLSGYSKEEIGSFIPRRRMYEDLVISNKDNMGVTAIEYFGKKISYKELIDNIDKAASAFYNMGVRKGDTVSVLMPYLPETVYSIYALNKIGAIVNMIDPRINDEVMLEFIEGASSKYIVIINKIEEKIERILDKTNVKEVISVSPTNEMSNIVLKTIGGMKKSKYTKWNSFMKRATGNVPMAEFKDEELAVIEYTSGTSGKPKGVMLSNEAFNSLAYFQKQSLINEVGDKFLLIMPPFIAYGLVIGMHDMLCQGQHLLMIPNFTLDKAPKMLGKLVDKHHPNYIMGVPNFLLILMNYDKDLSFLKGIIIGGDHLDKEIEKKANAYFKEHNSSATVLKGWGMTEISSCGTFTKNDIKNNVGSVGIPLSKNIVKVLPSMHDENARYDIDVEELYYGEEGTLFVSSPARTMGYFKNPDYTNKLFYTDKDGRVWINTGDIFMVDSDGSLYFKGREKRIVVRPDGHNIPSQQIESIASSFDFVDTAVVVGTPSRKYNHGSVATICVSFKDKNLTIDEINEYLRIIHEKCVENLGPRDRAKYYLEVNDMPYTMNGKVDYRHLTSYANSMIDDVELDEEEREVFYLIEGNTEENKKIRKRKLK